MANRRKRELKASGFPRSELWSWSLGSSGTNQAKDDAIENMLRECATTNGGPLSATQPPGGDLRVLRPHHQVSVGHPPPPQPQSPSLSSQQSTPSGSRRKLPSKALQASQQSQPRVASSRNLSPPASPPPIKADNGNNGGWRAYKLAHRTNKLMAKTRKFIETMSGEEELTGIGIDAHKRGSGFRHLTGTRGGGSDGNGSFACNNSDANLQHCDEFEYDDDYDGNDEDRAAALKLKTAKEMFEREVLRGPDDDLIDPARRKVDEGGETDDSRDFWQIYHSSSTSKRPGSARGRYIARCEEASLLVLPVLDLKRRTRYEPETKSLRYDNYYFGDKRAQALGDALNLLPVPVESLSMKNVGVTGAGSSAIMDGLTLRQLSHLNFAENKLGSKGTHKIYESLQDPHVNLKSLDLGNNQLGDQAVRLLIECLLNRCTLEHLDLRRNRIFHAAKAVGELLRISTPLRSLNLSWNNIRGEPAQHLAKCMMENITLVHLDMSDNTLGNNGNADAELGACLATNKSLRHLDISNNHVRGKSILVYVNGLQQNTVLETLVLRGNPIGIFGAESILRAVSSGSIAKCQIDIGECNMDLLDDSGHTTAMIYGGGVYNVDARERSDVALLRELLLLYWRNKVEIVESSLNGMPFIFNKGKDEKSLLNSIPSAGAVQLKVQPNYDRHEDPIPAHGFEQSVKLLARSFGHLRDGDEAAKLFCIRLLAEEYTFRVHQANELLALFRSHTTQVEKANAAAVLIPQIVKAQPPDTVVEVFDCASMETPAEFFEDKDNDGKIDVCGDICVVLGLENLSDIEQGYVETKVGKWVSFNPNNPTGRYQLNMTQSIDRRILMRILELNKTEKKVRQQLKLFDVSQHSAAVQPLQGGFRNVKLNRMPVAMGSGWEFPLLGVLEFDFVSTRRPYRICTALNDAAFEKFLKEFKQLQVSAEVKLIGLRCVSTLYYFTCSQTQRIMEHFGTFERDPVTGCLLRAEVFIILFSRIIDEWNYAETLALLDLATKTQVLDRLGYLNCFHPLQQVESYKRLHLQIYDQRQLVLHLVKLATNNEIELSNVMLNGESATSSMVEPEQWKTWVSDDKLPSEGVLSCSMRAMQPMVPETQLPPTCIRRKLLQTLLLKLDDQSQEPVLA